MYDGTITKERNINIAGNSAIFMAIRFPFGYVQGDLRVWRSSDIKGHNRD